MSEQRVVPEVRFAGFADPWEQRKLGECGVTYSGLSGKTKEDFGHGDALFIPYTNVFDNPISDVNRLEAVEIDSRQNEVRQGDVLFTVSSETPEEVGMSSVWPANKPNVYLNSFCFGYRQDGTFDSDYLAYMLRSVCVRDQLTLLAQGISRFNISKNKVMELSVPAPSTDEQQTIGRFFSRLDSLITLHQRKHDKLVVLKKTMLEKMFPKEGESVPEVRFAGFTDPWEQRKLGDIAEKVLAKNLDGSITEVLTNSAERGVISQTDYFDHAVAKENSITAYYVVEPGDFVYNPRISVAAPVGPIRRNTLGRCGVMSPLYTVFRLRGGVDGGYLGHFFKTDGWHAFMKLEGNSGARSDRFSIGDETFFEMPIPMPSVIEQHAIGAFFSRLDDLITLHQRK